MPVTLRVHDPRHRPRRSAPAAALPPVSAVSPASLCHCSSRPTRTTACQRQQRLLQQFQQ